MAMTLVSVAVGTGLYLQFGMGLWSAVSIALALYFGFVSVHALVRRSQAIRELSYEVDRLENEVMRIARGAGPVPARGPDQLPLFRPGPPPPPAGMGQGQHPPVMARPGPGGPPAGPANELSAYIPRNHQMAAPGGPMSPGRRQPHERPAGPVLPPAGGAGATSGSGQALVPLGAPSGALPVASDRNPAAGAPGSQSGTPMARFWSVRPTDPVVEAPRPGAKPATPPPMPTQASGSPPTPPHIPDRVLPRDESGKGGARLSDNRNVQDTNNSADDADIDAINDMIRRFSEEIGDPDLSPRTAVETSSDGNVDQGLLAREEAAISASVGALRAAVSEMRRPTEAGATAIEQGILPPLTVDPGSPKPPPVGPGHALVAQLADAITSEKLDVYLEPILGLADRKSRHFEISLRLRNGEQSIGPEQCLPIARSAGLLPQLDACRASRAAMMARHLDERGSSGSLFATIAAESLGSERFLGLFEEICRQTPKLRERLVFSVAQGELRGLTPAQWSTVRELAGSGFRFAIEDVSSVDLDLPELKAAGFAFIRIAAQALIDGIAGLDGAIPAAEVCRRLAGSGLTLVTVGLASEEQLDGVLGAGVSLGQGPLFGQPRPIKAEALRPAIAAA